MAQEQEERIACTAWCGDGACTHAAGCLKKKPVPQEKINDALAELRKRVDAEFMGKPW